MSYAHYDQSSPVRGSIIKMTCMESAGGEVGRRSISFFLQEYF